MSGPDIRVENHGSIFLLRPVTQEGRDWLVGSICIENYMVFGDAFACEPRYVRDIVNGAIADGLEVR